jgi:hypothetical protein
VGKNIEWSSAAGYCVTIFKKLFVYFVYVKWPLRFRKYRLRHLANRGWCRATVFQCRRRKRDFAGGGGIERFHLAHELKFLGSALKLRFNATAFSLPTFDFPL